MTSTYRATAFALLLGAASSDAFAQGNYGGTQAQQPREVQQRAEKGEAVKTLQAGEIKVSKEAFKALSELKSAVDGNDTGSIPAKAAAARAAAKTDADRYIIAQLMLKASATAKDEAGMASAIQDMLATKLAPASQTVPLNMSLAKILYNQKQFDKAAEAFERVIAADPANGEALVLLAETRNSQSRTSDAIGLLQKAILTKTSSGQKPLESWYKRAVGLAYGAKLPIALELSRQWVAAYPTSANWRDALKVYRGTARPDEALLLDTLRLARATGALQGDADFHIYAYNAVNGSSPGEAQAVIDEAAAAKQIDLNKPLFNEITATLKANTKLQRASLGGLAKDALASADARLAMRTADAYYGYGDYAEAAALYRAALTKSGVDANLANLRLGMSLARGGDKSGATAALSAVTGAGAELAKYWLIYVSTKA